MPPPGVGFTTVTEADPCVAMSAMEMEAVSFVLLENVVVRAAPFQFTTEPVTKFEPLTVSVKAGPPAVALLGEIELIAGTGLLMVNVIAFDVPPPGATFTTVTEAVPAVLMSNEGTAAVTLVLLTKVVVKAELFQCTFEAETKFDPLTVSVTEAPGRGARGRDRSSRGHWVVDGKCLWSRRAAAGARIRDGHHDCFSRGDVPR